MRRFTGIGASDGIAIGPARVFEPRLARYHRVISEHDVAAELAALERAVEAADQQLAAIGARFDAEHRHEGHAIVEAHRLILKSDELVLAARTLIGGERLGAETAVGRVVDGLVSTFAAMDDAYMKERGSDLEEVGERLLRAVVGLPEARVETGAARGAVGIGFTLSAVDALNLEGNGLAGVVTERGGRSSHAAIVVRSLELPYVAGAGGVLHAVAPGELVAVDGARGEVIVAPDEPTLAAFEERRRRRLAHARGLRASSRDTTADGVRIEIAANIDRLHEVPRAIELGADSVGLLRTELLYLDRRDLPTEDEQYADAVAALALLGGRLATFRTLDIGGEKLPASVDVPSGPNPSLGVRALRFSVRRPDIFKTQLRALYRASAMGPMRIMFPMVTGLEELRDAQAVCAAVRAELTRDDVPFDAHVPIGTMIETPSAALTADHLAANCDFLSIGTNDLIQYTLAADRENEDVDYLYDPLHPAVLTLLERTIGAAARAGKPLSVCGDMAADPASSWVLLGLGVRQLSMAPRHIPAVRSVVAGTRLAEARALVAEALQLPSGRQIHELVLGSMARRFPLELASAAAAGSVYP